MNETVCARAFVNADSVDPNTGGYPWNGEHRREKTVFNGGFTGRERVRRELRRALLPPGKCVRNPGV